jgi:hypothetical protein
MVYLKDGFWQLIDNISVEWNQKTVVQVQNFTNVHTQFKALTSFSADDLMKNGPILGFAPDTTNTLTYNATASISGIGFCNNASATSSARRGMTTAFNVADRAAATNGAINATEIPLSGKPYYFVEGSGANAIYHWVVYATIRLKDITDFFDKIPLCKTTDVRLTVTYNSANAVITKSGFSATPTTSSYTLTSYTQLSGHTCPFMIGATDAANAVAGTIQIRSGVVSSGLGTHRATAISNCRLYVPIYKPADNVALAMVQSFPNTMFEYFDVYNYVVPSIAASASFVHTLTTGIVDAQYVVVVPLPKTNALAGLAVATYQSPFDTCPGSTSPIMLKNFNVQIAGLNVFQADQRYDFEQFMTEVSKINAINGNNVTGLTSGLLHSDMWSEGHRFYVADVSRREASQDNVIKSITISGTNTYAAEIELICFVTYRKRATVKTATGTEVE